MCGRPHVRAYVVGLTAADSEILRRAVGEADAAGYIIILDDGSLVVNREDAPEPVGEAKPKAAPRPPIDRDVRQPAACRRGRLRVPRDLRN